VIVTADQSEVADSFWMRAIPQTACSDNDSTDNIKGIVYYNGSTTTPTTTGYSYTDSCTDENVTNLVPVVSKTVDTSFWDNDEPVTLGRSSDNLFRWYMNGTSMDVEWESPTLLQVYNNNTSFTSSSGVVELPNANEWAYVIIETTLPVPHPIHLHGHDFFVLSQGTGTYDADSTTLNLSNPPRRDTAMLPASGHLVVAFETDNPGTWLMHCHIGWHTSEGFAIQFLERYDEIRELVDYDSMESTCSAWETYADENSIEAEDSGV
jgi:FtsP/CotA-like multicopper oxidase with cupredoxin domain